MSSKKIGPDGVEMLYPTATGGSEWFMDMSPDPRTDSRFSFDNINSGASCTRKTEAGVTFFNTQGSPVHYKSGGDGTTIRMNCYPGGGKGEHQKFDYSNNTGYLYNPQGIAQHEFTAYVRVGTELGPSIHKSMAMKVNGGPDDNIRSLVETNYPVKSGGVYANWNYTHHAYEKVPNVKQIINVPILTSLKWLGIKSVHKISTGKSSFEYYVDLNPFDPSGKPNNNWQLAATWEDTGSPTYNSIKCTWKCMRDTLRIDGYHQYDVTLMSDREVDTSGSTPPPPPGVRKQTRHTSTPGEPVPDMWWIIDSDTGPLAPPHTCRPGQHWDDVLKKCVPDLPPQCPPGEHFDVTLNKCVPDIIPPPPSDKDEFGTLKIYADHPTHKAYLALKPGTEARQYEEKAVHKGNGRWSFPNGTQGRIELLPYDNAQPSDAPSYNLKDVLENRNGILHKDPDQVGGDWSTIGGIELTWNYKMISPGSSTHNGAAHTELVPGGFRQTNDSSTVGGVPSSCQAMSYHFNNYTDGRVKFEKDSQHTSGYTSHDPERQGALGNIVGKEVCQKAIYYAIPNPNHDPTKSGAGRNSKYFVKLEQYNDVGLTGSFTKSIEFLDDGTWGPTRGGNSACCSGDNAYEYVVLWMSRLAIGIRCDNMNDFEFWNVTCRSIDSSRPLHAAHAQQAPHETMIAEVVERD